MAAMNTDLVASHTGIAHNFWETLPRPIIGLAPMDGVTDHPFRHIQKKHGNPDVVYTEFTNVDALCHGDWQSQRNLLYDESQRPIIAQIYGRSPEHFRQVAIMLCELGFDGIDINMGCPAKSVANGGCGAGLIRTPDCAQAIVQKVKQGIQDWCNGATTAQCTRLLARFSKEVAARHDLLPATHRQRRPIPVSVKTRIGYDEPTVESWIPHLLESELSAICLHGRTLRQRYSGQADWDAIGRAAELARLTSTLILGNGDVTSRADGESRAADYGLDGVLIGRASFGNPFIFDLNQPPMPDGQDRQARLPIRHRLIEIALEHAHLYDATFRPHKHYRFFTMRKHLGWYVKDISGANYMRASLMQVNSVQEVESLFDQQKKHWRWNGPQ